DYAVRGLTLALGPSDPETLGALDLAAEIERGLGNYPAELRHYEATLEARRKKLKADDPDITISELNISRALFDVGEWRQARELQEQLLEKAKRQPGPEDTYNLSVTYHLAVTL